MSTAAHRPHRFARRIASLFAASFLAFPISALSAQTTRLATSTPLARLEGRAKVPFNVGEQLTYRASFGVIHAGTARMRVEGIELVRGRPAYHLVFTIDGGVPFFRVHDRYDSWIDVQTLSSLRHHQQIAEGRYKRTTRYEIYPERGTYEVGDSVFQSVTHPLDDGSFIYAVRTAGVKVGETRQDDRYFRPDRNPVVLTGLRQESVKVGAGSFEATVVKPSIKTSGIFSDKGEAQVWFSDDARRYPVMLRSKFAKFTLKLELQSIDEGVSPELAAAVSALQH
jgi:Protein of unknown function (DUF3108)